MAFCLPTCAQGSSVPVGNAGSGIFLGFLASLLCLVCLGGASFAVLPFAHKTWVTLVCLLLDTPLWAEFGGSITFVTTGGECSGSS